MKSFLFHVQKGDLAGGLSAAIITLPMSIAYGIAAFAALGPDFRPHAALIGINAAVIGGLFAALFGGTPTQISGPKAPLTLIMTMAVASLAADPVFNGSAEESRWVIVSLVSLCVVIGGFTQVISGLVGLGNLVKFVPYPVVSGFMNGIAILLIWNQLPPFIGTVNDLNLIEIYSDFALENVLNIFIGASTLFSIFLSKKYIKRIPAIFPGLIVGSSIYVLTNLLAGSPFQLASIGDLRSVIPMPTAFSELFRVPSAIFSGMWSLKIITYGIILGIIGSMESLMSAVAIDNIQGRRHDSKKELIGQGIGNIIASLFGTLYTAGSIPRSMANYRAGGRNKVSGACCSCIIIFLFLTFAPLIGTIPLSIFAAITIYVGINLFDRSTLRLFLALRKSGKIRRDIFAILSANIIVAIITVSINLISAVIIGLAISTAYFIIKTGTAVIRREYTVDQICSNKVRDRQQVAYLIENKNAIKVFELQGPIFFGSADRLAHIIEAKMADGVYCILDMKQVTEIDMTGANILVRLHKTLLRRNQRLLVSHMDSNHGLLDFLEISGIKREFSDEHFFPNTDLALESCEDQLLDQFCETRACKQYQLKELDIFLDFSAEELRTIEALLVNDRFARGEMLISEGDTDRDLYILTRGSVSVKMKLSNSPTEKRLFTFTAGVVFGEMALLDGKPRSADVQAEEDSEVFRLSFDNFQALLATQPQIAAKLLKNIALVLSDRLRSRSNELRLMADY